MTEAICYILISLAVLLFIHIFWLALLYRQQSQKVQTQPRESAQDYLIIYASQSGNAAALAHQTAETFHQLKISNRVIDIENLQLAELQQASTVLWMVSTYGEGDAPDSARPFIKYTMNQHLDLHRQKYAILALGDRHYSHFCLFGLRLESWLKQNQAQALFKTVCVDHLNPQDLITWKNQLEQEIECSLVDFTEIHNTPWSALCLIQRECVNPGSQGNPLYRVRLAVPAGFTWQSGDILEVQCANSSKRIQHFLVAYQDEIHALNPDFKPDSLKLKNLHHLPDRLNNESTLDWIARFEDLDFREYSVATTPYQGFIELVVRQEIDQGQLGLGSGWLTVHAEIGEMIQARIRANPSFHLSEKMCPHIFIGNGSGIAGLKSHLHQCEHWGYINNWLIYGERQQQYDVGFVDQLHYWKSKGTLTELDLVYSRDGHKVKYVSDCLYKKAAQLKTWIERGAVIYVCGSLKGMAQDVDHALTDILGDKKVQQLIAEKRYLRDVY